MHSLTLQLLTGSILISLTSMAAALALMWPHSQNKPVPSSGSRVQPAIHGAVHVSPRASSPTDSHLSPAQPVLTAPKPENVHAASRAENSDWQKNGGTPRVLPPADESTLQLLPFSDEVYVLFNDRKLSHMAQRRALSRLMLLPGAPTEDLLLSEQGIPLLKRPFYYGRILDQRGQPVRYPLQAAQLADQLLARSEVDEAGWRVVRIPLKGVDWTMRAQDWLQPVRALAGEQTPLVLAMMEVESGFRPDAVSHSGAVGLMQIKPDKAGRDVAAMLGQNLDHGQLLAPDTNLKAGVTYLRLLQQRYLAGVRDPRSREYLTIAAYNGGINAVLRQFGKTAEAAIDRINRLTPDQVYRILRHQFPRRETRLYLEKVTQAKNRYRAWMADNV